MRLTTEEQVARTREPDLVLVPGWEHYPWLRAGFSTRYAGGSSVYGESELNLGWTKEDDSAVVKGNRAEFVRAVAQGAAMELVTVGQVHSAVVRDLQQHAGPLMTEEGKAVLEGDGLIGQSPGRLLAVLTADCVPVLVADRRTHAVGAFHAGWRGTLGRIAEQGVGAMHERYGSRPEDLVAAVGPCIRACCFEVGDEVVATFRAQFAYAAELIRGEEQGDGKLHLNLVEANRQQLLEAGVPKENVSIVAECTACARLADDRRKFYSYRDERGVCGRMLSAIGAVA